MAVASAKTVRVAYSLNAEMVDLAHSTGDGLTSSVADIIREFQKTLSGRRSFSWRYLKDEHFEELFQSAPVPSRSNRLLLSHLVRLFEAYQIISIWRVIEVAAPAVRALNSNEITAACVLTRSLLELSASYAEAAPYIEKAFTTMPWESLENSFLGAQELETYVTRLVFGTRLGEPGQPLSQKNILSILQKLDKVLRKKGANYVLEDQYALLSEAAHPNHLGFERFMEMSEFDPKSLWSRREVTIDAKGPPRDLLASACLWALAFSHWVMLANFRKFDNAKLAYLEAFGKPLP
jgi:hypothetical protein